MFISILNIIQTYMYAYVWLNSHKSTYPHAFNAHNIMNWMCYVNDQARTDTNIDLIVKIFIKLIMFVEESLRLLTNAMYNHSIWHGGEGGDGKCNFPIFQCKYYMH